MLHGPVRLRQPDAPPTQTVAVDGKPRGDFDAAGQWVRIANPTDARYTVEAHG